MDPSALSTFLNDHGFPIMVAVTLFVFIWRTVRWMARELIIPVRDSFLKHMEDVRDLMESVPATLVAIEQQAAAATASVSSVNGKVKGTNTALRAVLEAAIRTTDASRERLGEEHYRAIMDHLNKAKAEFA